MLTVIAPIEFFIVLIVGKVCGISSVVRYLRNPNPKIAVGILRAFGAVVGKKTSIKRSLIIDNALGDQNSRGDFSNLRIGCNCYIGDNVYFDLADTITIGDNVILSAEAAIITHADCNRSEFLSKMYPRHSNPVIINSDVWLCFRATILSGVVIGSYSVILANSLVTDHLEPRSVCGGTPARKIHGIEENRC